MVVSQLNSLSVFPVVWRGFRLRLSPEAQTVAVDKGSYSSPRPILQGSLLVEQVSEPASQAATVIQPNEGFTFSVQRPFALFPLTLDTSMCLTHYRVPDALNGSTTNRLFAQRVKTPQPGEALDFVPVLEPGLMAPSDRELRLLEPASVILSSYSGGEPGRPKMARWHRQLLWHCDVANGKSSPDKAAVYQPDFHTPVLVLVSPQGDVSAQDIQAVMGAVAPGMTAQLCRLVTSYLSLGPATFGESAVTNVGLRELAVCFWVELGRPFNLPTEGLAELVHPEYKLFL